MYDSFRLSCLIPFAIFLIAHCVFFLENLLFQLKCSFYSCYIYSVLFIVLFSLLIKRVITFTFHFLYIFCNVFFCVFFFIVDNIRFTSIKIWLYEQGSFIPWLSIDHISFLFVIYRSNLLLNILLLSFIAIVWFFWVGVLFILFSYILKYALFLYFGIIYLLKHLFCSILIFIYLLFLHRFIIIIPFFYYSS